MDPLIYLIAGEQSGDSHGALLIESLKKKLPQAQFEGIGGSAMEQKGLISVLDSSTLHIMGFSDILKAGFNIWFFFKKLRTLILQKNPAAVIFIDFPDFNLLMAKSLRKHGYRGRLVHYISPSVWAWRKNRIYTMAKTLDLLLTIFPFEAAYYAKVPLKVAYSGNPTWQACQEAIIDLDFRLQHHIPQNAPLLGLFPGSRLSEIYLNLSAMIQTARLLQKDNTSLVVAISVANSKVGSLIKELSSDLILIPSHQTHSFMKNCRAAIATSGTVTLELGLFNVPTLLVYKISFLNRLIAKYLIRLRLPYIGLTNILRQKKIFPELIDKEFTPNAACEALRPLMEEGLQRQKCLEELDIVKEMLAPQKNLSPSDQAATSIANLLDS